MKDYYKNGIRRMLDNDLIPFEKIEFVYCFMLEAENREKKKRNASREE